MSIFGKTEDEFTESKLASYFSDELSAGENKDIEEWIVSSESNRHTAKDIARIIRACEDISIEENTDTELALAKVHNMISRTKSGHIFGVFMKIAAILILPLLISSTVLGWMLYQENHKTPAKITLATNSGMTSHTTLPDGTEVWLNSNSTLVYPSEFSSTREVQLKGEAFFKVTKQNGRKFIVNANAVEIEVRGTEFNVEAYCDCNSDIRTSLISGSIALRYTDPLSKRHEVIVKPGEQYSFNNTTSKLSYSKINPLTVSAWKEGKIILNNTNLAEALRMIGNRFNVEFLIRNKELLKNRYTGTFESQRLEIILEHFSRTTNMKFDCSLQSTDEGSFSGRQLIIVD